MSRVKSRDNIGEERLPIGSVTRPVRAPFFFGSLNEVKSVEDNSVMGKKKTLKIDQKTHEKLDEIKKKMDLRSLGDVIDRLLFETEGDQLSLSFDNSHCIVPTEYEHIKFNSRITFKINGLKNLDKKVNVMNLLHRAVINSNAYFAMSDHYKLKKYVTKLELEDIESSTLVESIRKELENIKLLSEKFIEINQ